ncbi:nuclear transport factor 2 family protein [Ulvibacter antarcticus]|uniref:Ketosteroid isomerase-like protein n=1 Tax=Ulvibacter antarcticus TaxID=442714 RepID=A0A3L9YWM7_9FLAO|nr:nuclear transport factor 2 family protein [Ulvibacter antarcticus]RMA64724.1 ketosteroid isomerase-like protein [Ulvibacter antarcticus]
MKENDNIIVDFYQAFEKLDAEKMVACYHPDITFQDPAFGVLKGEDAKNMWRMLCHSQKGKDFRVKASEIECSRDKAKAKWEAFYTFSQTGRKVHNSIHAEFEIKDGKIIKHVDSFNLYSWAKQAMGFKGLLLGWTGFFRKKLNAQTNKLLRKFIANQEQQSNKK